MKYLHRTLSTLFLSLLLCVIFLNLSSVNAYAYNADDIQYQNLRWQNTSEYNTHLSIYNTSGTLLFNKSFSLSNSTYDEANNTYSWNTDEQYSNVSQIAFGLSGSPLTVTLLPDVYDYYFAWTVYNLNGNDVNTFSFIPDRFVVQSYDCNTSPNVYTDLIEFDCTHYDTSKSLGFTVTGKLPDNFSSSQINRIILFDNSGGSLPKGFYSSGVVLAINKNSSVSSEALIASLLQDINNSINSQTGQIIDKIDQVLSPEGNNPLGESVEQITDQVQENLGVLGFAHYTIDNFIHLFIQEPPPPIISVPPLNLKIKGTDYQFFNGYEFDLRSLEYNGLELLFEAARTTGIIVLWLAFFQYCFEEFDKFFRR